MGSQWREVCLSLEAQAEAKANNVHGPRCHNEPALRLVLRNGPDGANCHEILKSFGNGLQKHHLHRSVWSRTVARGGVSDAHVNAGHHTTPHPFSCCFAHPRPFNPGRGGLPTTWGTFHCAWSATMASFASYRKPRETPFPFSLSTQCLRVTDYSQSFILTHCHPTDLTYMHLPPTGLLSHIETATLFEIMPFCNCKSFHR